MSITDIVILIIIGVFGVKGLFKGLIGEVFGILGLILGYVIAYQYYSYGAKLVNFFGLSNNVASKIGFIILFLIVYILVLVIAFFLKKFFKAIQLGWADKSGGFFFGAVKSAVVLSIVLSILITVIPPRAKIVRDLKTSVVSSYLLSITPMIFEMLNKLPEVKKHNPFTY